jgi:hypothetical protein
MRKDILSVIFLCYIIPCESFLIIDNFRIPSYIGFNAVSQRVHPKFWTPLNYRKASLLSKDLRAQSSNSAPNNRVLQNKVLDEVVKAATCAVEQSTGEGTESGGPGEELGESIRTLSRSYYESLPTNVFHFYVFFNRYVLL